MKGLSFEALPWGVRQAGMVPLGVRNRWSRFGSEYQRWRALLDRTRHWSPEERTKWQLAQLVGLVRTARSGTEHYATLLSARELASSESLAEALSRLPILEKESLRALPNTLKNQQVVESTTSSTSGSTGAPMTVGHDKASLQRRFAFLADHRSALGLQVRSPSVRLSGRILCEVGKPQRRPWLLNPAENQLFLSSYHLDAEHSSRIAGRLKRLQPQLIDGYPSGVLETLRVLRKENMSLSCLRAVITTAETLHDSLREEISELSGLPVCDYYAASEGVPIVQQCSFGTYHVRWQSGVFEVVTPGGPALEGDGELLCTSFVQDRTPLIRYRTGDVVQGLRHDTEICRCGLRTPTVERVRGRVEDMVYTPDGRAMGMFTYRTLKYIQGLGETQVIQHDYAAFEVNSVVSEANAAKFAGLVQQSFERALGYPISLSFKAVERLPRGPGGKVRLVVSKVARSTAS